MLNTTEHFDFALILMWFFKHTWEVLTFSRGRNYVLYFPVASSPFHHISRHPSLTSSDPFLPSSFLQSLRPSISLSISPDLLLYHLYSLPSTLLLFIQIPLLTFNHVIVVELYHSNSRISIQIRLLFPPWCAIHLEVFSFLISISVPGEEKAIQWLLRVSDKVTRGAKSRVEGIEIQQICNAKYETVSIALNWSWWKSFSVYMSYFGDKFH